jgi:hypothetical protein
MNQRTASPRRALVFIKGENGARYEADVVEHERRINLFQVIERTGRGGQCSDRTIPYSEIRLIRYQKDKAREVRYSK